MKELNSETFSKFLMAGAFVRTGADEVHLWIGPLAEASEREFSIIHHPYFSAGSNYYSSSVHLRLGVDELTELADHYATQSGALSREDFEEPSFEKFDNAIGSIQERIGRNEIQKAVSTIFARADRLPSYSERATWLSHLLKIQNSNLIPYGFWKGDQGLMGATPETLFHLKSRTLTTMALAGTCPKAEVRDRTHLLLDAKERLEHDFVVKDLEERLGHWGQVKRSETEVLELPSLYHLVTRFEAEIGDISIEKILRFLHPTAALGVFPRQYGHQWLSEISDSDGFQFFGSPLGFRLGSNEVLCLIAIRNIQWGARGTFVGSGAGIVAESKLDREWQELQAKRDSVFSSLGIQ